MSHALLPLMAFIAPLALLLVAHARALRGEPKSLFEFAGRAQWITALAVLVWIPAAAPVWNDVPPDAPLRSTAILLALVGPPLVTLVALQLALHDVARRTGMTEWTGRRAWADAGLLFGLTLAPLLGLAGAVDGFRAGLGRGALGILVSGIALAVALSRQRGRVAGPVVQAITSGELRDRVFALAGRAGVTLRQLHVVQVRQFRMANAFAVQGNEVRLTDLLLRELDRDEVDAVLAHEMAHLARRDPARLLGLLIAVTTAGTISQFAVGWIGCAVVVSIGTLTMLAIQRRIEHATDARALELGADPRALITGLVRVHGLSGVPVRWSRWQALWMSHPSVERRAAAIAARAGMAADVAAAWLDAPPAPGLRYAIPPAVDHPRRFGSEFKRGVVARLSWTMLGAVAVVPALVVAGLGALEILPGLVVGVLAVAGGLGAFVAVLALGSKRPLAGVERALRRDRDLPDATPEFVGLAPGDTPRLYEGFAEWDVGFLEVAPGWLEYRGEEASFTLAATDVLDVWVDAGLPSWTPIHAVRVSWRDAGGEVHAFGMIPLGRGDLFTMRREARRLREALDAWRAGPPASGSANVLGAPPTRGITSASPRDMLQPAGVVVTMILIAVMSLAASFLTGAPLTGAAAIASLIAYVAGILPVLRWREPAPPAPPTEERRAA